MSLETAGFIKDLVPTNPEGTDPKSQGDDHLRMIKAVLKAQFPGFTEGVGIALTETNLNMLGGVGANDPALNLDTPVSMTYWTAVNTGSTGTFPPTGVAGGGDMVLNVCYASNRIYQIYFRSLLLFSRRWDGTAWSTWLGVTGIGGAQVWTDVTGGRVLGNTYTNTTGRPIQISILLSGSTTARSSATLNVAGAAVAAVTTSEQMSAGTWFNLTQTLTAIVPDGVSYAVSVAGTHTLTKWVELR